MMIPLDSLTALGSQNALQIETAYETVIMAVSLGQLDKFPDRTTRLAIVVALLAEGRAFGFDQPKKLAAAGLAAAFSVTTPGVRMVR